MVTGRLDDVIHLREKDEGKEIAAKLNQFNQNLSEKIRQIDNCSKNIEVLLSQHSMEDSSAAIGNDIQSVHAQIIAQNQTLQSITKTFQLVDE
jgi:methyl-accepting chemotaxis protein